MDNRMHPKKQGIIEHTLPHKPSFKNILNIDQARLPSRSNQKKPNKSRSHKKASSIITKSPKKLILRPSQISYQASQQQYKTNENVNHNVMPYQSQYKSQRSIGKNVGREMYQDVNSQISRSNKSRSPKKDVNRESLRQVILMKNKCVEVERLLDNLQRQNLGSNTNTEHKIRRNKTVNYVGTLTDVQYEKQTVQTLKNMGKQLDNHISVLKQTQKQKQQEYSTRIDQMNIQTNQFDNQISGLVSKAQKKSRLQPGMPDLQAKLQLLQKMFS